MPEVKSAHCNIFKSGFEPSANDYESLLHCSRRDPEVPLGAEQSEPCGEAEMLILKFALLLDNWMGAFEILSKS